jgi:hypothetical protein
VSATVTATTLRPVPKPIPIVRGHVARALVAVESDLFDATTELVHQRADLVEAASPENNALLERVLRIEGLPPLARELIRAALFIEQAEDAAARRAERRRAAAHDFDRSAIGGCERMLTGRGDDA